MSNVHSIVYPILLVIMLVAFTFKVRHLRGRWGNPRLVAVCAVILAFCGVLWTVTPANFFWLGSVTGIPNIGIPLIQSLLAMTSASYLAVALLWRYPARVAWRQLRWIFMAYAIAIILMVFFFSMSTTSEPRPTDWSFYYGTQPAVAASTTIWIAAELVGAAILAVWCFTWAGSGDYAEMPWLRRGLLMYGVFGVCMVVFSIGVLIPHVALWFGVQALTPVGVLVPPIVGSGAMVALFTALVAPVWGPRLAVLGSWFNHCRAFILLRPLHRSLSRVSPNVIMVAEGKRFNPQHRVRRMLIELNDWRWTLTPLFDPTTAQEAEERGRQAGLQGEELAVIIEAAQLSAAAHTWNHNDQTTQDTTASHQDEDARDGDTNTELTWWIRISQAYKSPIVAQTRTKTSTTTKPARAA